MASSLFLDQYDYELKLENIGRSPAEPRDHAKLFVYDTKADKIFIDRFYNISKYLPANSLMVMNNSGVIPARVNFTKDTGGKVEGLILFNEGIQEDGTIPTIVNKKLLVDRKIFVGDYGFLIARQDRQYFYLKPQFDVSKLEDILLKYGTTPIPKYLGDLEMEEDSLRQRYQTIYAKENKSVAAPTASLHFTDRVFESLKAKEIERTELSLHIGMGTFAEVSEKNIEEKKLHIEPISISKRTIQRTQEAKKDSRDIIAVGTTAIRSLESQADKILVEEPKDIATDTDLFIMPGFEYQIADILITNFHVPKSSLMSLVDAFLKHKKSKKTILELYSQAQENDFKFYSFGDSMVIL